VFAFPECAYVDLDCAFRDKYSLYYATVSGVCGDDGQWCWVVFDVYFDDIVCSRALLLTLVEWASHMQLSSAEEGVVLSVYVL
jgi:hypothetical protein